jgi:RNA polymerase sigma-70 factor (ECF subfamily)
MKTGDLDDALSAFFSARPRLFGIAYRMLGSAVDAEDIVQDVWLQWQTVDRSVVRDAPAYLATTTVRRAINHAQSAPSRRETYVGEWLPEPVDTSADPGLGAERAEALEMAILTLLETLSPTERAAYILREAFEYSYQEIADILNLTDANARQIVTRARKRVTDGRRAPVGQDEHRRLLEAFIAASRAGDLAALEGLFASDVISRSDGGGVVRAAKTPVVGRERVAKFITSFSSHFWNGLTVRWVEANGRTAALLLRDGAVAALAAISASNDGIDQIMWVMRPSKLASISGSLPSPHNTLSPDDQLR